MRKFFITLLIILSLTGCTPSNKPNSEVTTTQVTIVTSVVTDNNTTTTTSETTNSVSETTTTNIVEPTTNFETLQSYFSNIVKCDDWKDGAYIEVNHNKPMFTNITTDVFENYSKLDSLGRCGIAYANICKELQPTEKRGSIGMVKPSGWKTSNYNEYPGLIDGNYLYNRCHLIGYQLAGENANEKNLITGTRYLNVTGMLPFENMVDNYIEVNPKNHVLYRVTPSYIGNDLIAQGVLMEAYSVEDNGKLQFCVWCPNIQPGIHIDYSTGDNYYSNNTKTITTQNNPDTSNEQSETYILNTKSKKIHRTTCSAVKDMKEENKETVHKSISELESEGYTRCGICKP